ncbi:MAG: hypothetical protein HZA50_02615 [Planctomycetes bacterium]|nr:hypothetical protein [Planctomycetota bacterium]
MKDTAKISEVWTASGKPYLVCPGGMATGSQQYIDRHYTFGQMPEYLEEHTYIRTSGDDKVYEEDDPCLSFTVDRDVDVYILHGMPFLSLPAWLREFRDTGDFVYRPATEDPRNMRFRGLVKSYPKGRIILNGDLPKGMLTPEFRAGGGAGFCMYSVAIAPKK